MILHQFLVWAHGSQVAKGFNQYFEELLSFLNDIGKPLERLQIYEELFRSTRFSSALGTVFEEFLKFTQRTRRMFIDKRNRSRK